MRESTLKDSKKNYVHEMLRSARRSMNALVREKALFTFVEIAEEYGGTWDRTNNVIEGGVNAQIRPMLRHHRGLSSVRRVKAAFWWCCFHSDFKVPEAQMLKTMKTDEEVEGLFVLASKLRKEDDGSPELFDNTVPEWQK